MEEAAQQALPLTQAPHTTAQTTLGRAGPPLLTKKTDYFLTPNSSQLSFKRFSCKVACLTEIQGTVPVLDNKTWSTGSTPEVHGAAPLLPLQRRMRPSTLSSRGGGGCCFSISHPGFIVVPCRIRKTCLSQQKAFQGSFKDENHDV